MCLSCRNGIAPQTIDIQSFKKALKYGGTPLKPAGVECRKLRFGLL